MLYPILSLTFFALAIAIGCLLKKNTGIVSISFTLILAIIAGASEKFSYITDKWVLNSFDSSLFIMLLGVMYLFCIAEDNHTLELLARKALLLCKGKVKLVPVALFVLGAIISAIGPGLISTTALMAVLAMAFAAEANVDPIKFLLFGGLGAFAGGLSPITPSGIVAIEKAKDSGITGIALPIALFMFLIMLFIAIILYFFVFKWHKYKESGDIKVTTEDESERFQLKHICTIVGIVLTAVVSTVLDIKIGLVAFAVALILTICGFADEGVALKKIPWNTLIMITGVGMLISLVTELGGIDLLSDGLSSLMGEKTAASIITVLAGVMSWVSSASGVVMPTLIPTVTSLPGVDTALVTGICIGANVAAFSPLSSCGGLMLAAYSGSKIATPEGRNKMFGQLFLFSCVCIVISAIFALIGCFDWF